MESYNLELIEQPVPRWDLRGLSKIRKSLHTPIMVDESVLSPMDVMKVIERDAADIINIKLMKVGGLSNAKKIATVAEAAGLPCLLGSMIELSIGTAAGVHFACSTRNIRYATELVGTSFAKDDIVKEAFLPKQNYFEPIEKPGLGIEIDENRLQRYACKDF